MISTRSLRAAALGLLVATVGCSTVQQPQRGYLQAVDTQLRECALWYHALDAEVARYGVADVAARRIDGFPYLRADRFTSAFRDRATSDIGLREDWVERMRLLDRDGRHVEIMNLPALALDRLGAEARHEVLSRVRTCAGHMAKADWSDPTAFALLQQRARVADDYSAVKRAIGLYAVTRVPFSRGIDDWQQESTQMFAEARAGESVQNPVVRYVPPDTPGFTRKEVAGLLAIAASEPMGIPELSTEQRERLFATYAPVVEVETAGDFDRIGSLFWSSSPAPQVDVTRPTVYRKFAYTRVDGRTLLQLVYVMWFPERPRQHTFDILAGRLDGIVWRVTLAPDGEPVVYDTIHPCGCYHMFFPTPRAMPVPSPDRYVEWAFTPASLPAIPEQSRIVLSVQTRTHYLRNVWPAQAGKGARYVFAEYDALRTLPLPDGSSRSVFGPEGLVPGTERGERYLFWPMGIASAGAMRQWGTQATAFVGRRHFDDADLIEKRFRLLE